MDYSTCKLCNKKEITCTYLLIFVKCQIYLVTSLCRSLLSTLYITNTDREKEYLVHRIQVHVEFTIIEALSNLQCL